MTNEQTPPLVSDEQMVGYREGMSPGERLHATDLSAFAVRSIYEADRQKTREVVQALVNGIETMRQGSFADKFIFADDADLDAHADRLLALAKSQMNIEPTKP